jgi:GGDEF domain-containing protein
MPDNYAAALLGGSAMEAIIADRLTREQPLAVMFIAVNHFKPYTGEYGWQKGEELIETLAQILAETVHEQGTAEACAGRILGGRFVLVCTPAEAQTLAERIIRRFDVAALGFYSAQDRERHFTDGLDRRGNPFRDLLASLAIAIITNEQRTLEHYLQIEELSAEVLSFIKLWPGSNFAFDARRK